MVRSANRIRKNASTAGHYLDDARFEIFCRHLCNSPLLISQLLGLAIVVPPLQTIQMQMACVCEEWGIPHVNLSDIQNPSEIQHKIDEAKPKIILASIEDISNHAVQSQLQTLDIKYIAIDECQVS